MSNSSDGRPPVGVIGIGLMGAALTERLLDDGYPVLVYNRTRAKADPLIARGARWSNNPLAECSRVVISLYSTHVVETVLRPMERALQPGTILLDTTTGDPQRMGDIGAYYAKRGAQYLEVPISGSSEQTRRHQSTALAAGSPEAFAASRDLLDCLAAKTYYVGPWGNGVRMKLVTNLVLGLNRAVLAEGLVFAKAVGLDPQESLDVLLNSPAYSRTMEGKGPKMVRGDFTPQAKLSQHIKDVLLILEEAGRAGKLLPLSQLHLQLLERAQSDGLGQLDNSAIISIIDDALAASLSSAG